MTEYCQSIGAQNRDLANPGYNAIGQIFETGHILIGQTVTKVTFYLKKGVATSLGGTYNAAIHAMDKPYADETNPTLISGSSTHNASALPATITATEFTFSSPRTLQDGDMISIQSENVTSDSGSVIILQNDDTAKMTNGNWARTTNNWATAVNTDETAQMKLCVEYGAVPSTGTRLPPPPIILSGL